MAQGSMRSVNLTVQVDVVDDTTPQLGGSLDVNGNKIVSVSNGDIDIEPNGTGNVLLGNLTIDADQTVGAGQDNYVLAYDDASGTMVLTALAGAGISNVVEDTTPQLGGQLDVNGNAIGDGTLELITFTETGSAVNQVNIANAATGSGPTVSAAGDDTNIDLNISPKGTGKTKITSIEAPLDINTQTGTTYGPVLSDAEKMITLDNASPITVTIPANASVAYPVGTKLNFLQLGAGAATIAITTDTLNVNADLTAVLNGQYASATAIKITSTTWTLIGNLVAA